ncbi:DoxX family protein [Sutcliffiella rhizosphaerae]|uniref:Oxidoreductase CatD n=1 Tax=Sutcliffiella rhizosphaerae TaxID=2880967 RepID=A0ABN8AFP9_9BACI|nr:DoxX family protein [Sutcliffiella rhizosphaerae]CAG9623024.1 Putative oxidoreductase CatD [Sutcliffiella rhizosphaerae]
MPNKGEIATTVMRVFLGITFFIHGLAKFQSGIENTAGFFESLGLPGWTAYVIALIELIGGLAMILGLGTRIAAILFVLIMAVAIVKVKFSVGFLDGYELDLALMVISIYLAAINRTFLALDNVFFGKEKGSLGV